ncbi:hypothetical protein TNCV_3011911, partial [Trichonephila clavipes]
GRIDRQYPKRRQFLKKGKAMRQHPKPGRCSKTG